MSSSSLQEILLPNLFSQTFNQSGYSLSEFLNSFITFEPDINTIKLFNQLSQVLVKVLSCQQKVQNQRTVGSTQQVSRTTLNPQEMPQDRLQVDQTSLSVTRSSVDVKTTGTLRALKQFPYTIPVPRVLCSSRCILRSSQPLANGNHNHEQVT